MTTKQINALKGVVILAKERCLSKKNWLDLDDSNSIKIVEKLIAEKSNSTIAQDAEQERLRARNRNW